jgi:hypothetical protein
MTKLLRDAMAKVEALPAPVQERIAQELIGYVDKINALRADLNEGLRQLDAGQEREIDFDQLLKRARAELKKS